MLVCTTKHVPCTNAHIYTSEYIHPQSHTCSNSCANKHGLQYDEVKLSTPNCIPLSLRSRNQVLAHAGSPLSKAPYTSPATCPTESPVIGQRSATANEALPRVAPRAAEAWVGDSWREGVGFGVFRVYFRVLFRVFLRRGS